MPRSVVIISRLSLEQVLQVSCLYEGYSSYLQGVLTGNFSAAFFSISGTFSGPFCSNNDSINSTSIAIFSISASAFESTNGHIFKGSGCSFQNNERRRPKWFSRLVHDRFNDSEWLESSCSNDR